MRNGKTAVAIALALGLTYVPPIVYADHHEGSGIGHATSEGKDAADTAMEMKEEVKAEAADTADEATGKMEEKAGEAAKKMSEGSH